MWRALPALQRCIAAVSRVSSAPWARFPPGPRRRPRIGANLAWRSVATSAHGLMGPASRRRARSAPPTLFRSRRPRRAAGHVEGQAAGIGSCAEDGADGSVGHELRVDSAELASSAHSAQWTPMECASPTSPMECTSPTSPPIQPTPPPSSTKSSSPTLRPCSPDATLELEWPPPTPSTQSQLSTQSQPPTPPTPTPAVPSPTYSFHSRARQADLAEPQQTQRSSPTEMPVPTPTPTRLPSPIEKPVPACQPSSPTELPVPTGVSLLVETRQQHIPTEMPVPTDIPQPSEMPVPTDLPQPSEMPVPFRQPSSPIGPIERPDSCDVMDPRWRSASAAAARSASRSGPPSFDAAGRSVLPTYVTSLSESSAARRRRLRVALEKAEFGLEQLRQRREAREAREAAEAALAAQAAEAALAAQAAEAPAARSASEELSDTSPGQWCEWISPTLKGDSLQTT